MLVGEVDTSQTAPAHRNHILGVRHRTNHTRSVQPDHQHPSTRTEYETTAIAEVTKPTGENARPHVLDDHIVAGPPTVNADSHDQTITPRRPVLDETRPIGLSV